MPLVRPALGVVLLALVVTLAPAADPQAAEKAKADKDGWVKLFDGKSLTGWKVADFVGTGKVQVKDGAVVMEEGDGMTGATYAGKDFPTTDYEVTFEGKKLTGNDFFCTTTFPVEDAFCSLVVGGWGGTTVGLSSINGQDASANETNKSMEFKKDQWYRVRLRVSKNRIEAWIADEKLVDFDATDANLSIRLECQPSKPFGFCTWHTGGAVRDVRLRKLTEADKKAIAATKPGEKK